MKVYYVASTEFYKNNKKKFEQYRETISKLSGSKTITFTERQSKEFDFAQDQDELRKLVKDTEKGLKDADVVIADITSSSAGPGYDIASALNMKKPVLVLKRDDDDTSRGPHSITVKKSKQMNYIKYNDENFEKIVQDFLSKAKQQLDTKFILIISPEIDRYLEWASSTRRMHKAQVVRNAVEDAMSKDKEWKKAQGE